MVKTKIIATLGPSTDKELVLRKMFIAGLDVVRLNFSHGDKESHSQRVELIRNLNRKLKRAIKIMQDLEGFRIRIGELPSPRLLHKRESIYLTQDSVTSTEKEIGFDYKGDLKAFKKDTLIYIDDGKIILKVRQAFSKSLKTEVIRGGMLYSRKGVNIPEVNLKFAPLTEKDKKDLTFSWEHQVDYLAQSFVRNAKDILTLKKFVNPYHPSCRIFAKIENVQALKNLEEIIKVSDGIIVARGDLGVCVPIYQVPIIQKEIIKKCRKTNKPVVVATQMLDSMTTEVIPTRAEVSDVANAIFDGADYLLLSSETAVGKHPSMVVEMMNKIIKYTEAHI